MNIGIIGSGGREHALCKKISESKSVNKVIEEMIIRRPEGWIWTHNRWK